MTKLLRLLEEPWAAAEAGPDNEPEAEPDDEPDDGPKAKPESESEMPICEASCERTREGEASMLTPTTATRPCCEAA